MSDIPTIREKIKKSVTLSQEKATRSFKTQKGAYAEKDIFIGVTVPHLRKIAKHHPGLSLSDLRLLLSSEVNEERQLALILLVAQYQELPYKRREIYDFYLQNISHVNNWNLVDCSAHLVIGAHLWDKERNLLYRLASSKVMWERRIAIVATWYFIRKGDLDWTFKIAKILLQDRHDLIHKAAGWMLREAGKRKEAALLSFLDQHTETMPRTMLRYAIEKLSDSQRKNYLLRDKLESLSVVET